MYPLSVTNAKKVFALKNGKTVAALDGVSLQVEDGTIHGLLGPNGAGKSTLINLISGITKPSEGALTVFDTDVSQDPEKAKQYLGAVPQEISVELAFSVYEVLYYFCGMYGVPVNERKARIEAVLEDLQLTDKMHERARGLLGGMKRRLMIAKAILHKPRLLILDEPTAGVDVALRQKIWELVRRLNTEDKTTILFTTHYLEEAEQLCESITLIDHGRVIKDGKLKEIQKEFSQNVIHFELFSRDVPHLPGVTPIGVEFELPVSDLEKDLAQVAAHYGDNLKSLSSGAASLESIFLNLTQK